MAAATSQFSPRGANAVAFFLLLAGFSLLIALTVPLGRFLKRPRVAKSLDWLTGCIFLAFGARLAVAQHAGA